MLTRWIRRNSRAEFRPSHVVDAGLPNEYAGFNDAGEVIAPIQRSGPVLRPLNTSLLLGARYREKTLAGIGESRMLRPRYTAPRLLTSQHSFMLSLRAASPAVKKAKGHAMPQEFRMVAKTLFGLEGVLAEELRGLRRAGNPAVQPARRFQGRPAPALSREPLLPHRDPHPQAHQKIQRRRREGTLRRGAQDRLVALPRRDRLAGD